MDENAPTIQSYVHAGGRWNNIEESRNTKYLAESAENRNEKIIVPVQILGIRKLFGLRKTLISTILWNDFLVAIFEDRYKCTYKAW